MQSSIQTKDKPCLICGEETFTWGHLKGVYGPTSFVPRSDKGAGNILSNIISKGGQAPMARACDACGNVQLFIDHDDTA